MKNTTETTSIKKETKPDTNTGKTKKGKQLILKPAFLKALSDAGSNVSSACRAVKINRSTYYGWMEKDIKFSEAVEDIKESMIDLAESKLMELVKEKNITAIIFFLKTRGKDRGYIEVKPVQYSRPNKKLAELDKLLGY